MNGRAGNCPREAEFLIIGAGMAGASVAHWLAPHGRVIVLERESEPGYHATGRSAALFFPSYGSAQVRALTLASRAFLEAPPGGFCEHPLLSPRGALTVGTQEQLALLDRQWEVLASISSRPRRLDAAQMRALVPVLRADRLAGGVYEPEAFDMDVNGLHQGFLRAMKRAGGMLVCGAEVEAIERDHTAWHVHAGKSQYRARVLINAAGAWVDLIAQRAGVAPIGIQPRRRSAFLFDPPAGVDVRAWPLVMSADEDWYIKPDAGLLLGSPANADPNEPADVQADELDIALAINRIESMTTLEIRRPTRIWAGLRSFVADGNLVGGFDRAAPDFFWLAAQGGYGIQTSPAMGEACASLVRRLPVPDAIANFGVTAESLSPARLAPAQLAR